VEHGPFPTRGCAEEVRTTRKFGVLALLLASFFGRAAHAADSKPEVEVHGFVSQGFIKTTDNNYLAYSKRGSAELTEVGINFTTSVTDRLRIGVQLFARDLGPVGNYQPQFDWFFLDYRFFDWFGIRAGRTKLPFGLYNEVNDIDSARVPILLPQSVYPTQQRDYLLAQTGGEVYGDVPLGQAGALEYRGYGGTIYVDSLKSNELSSFKVPYVVGGRLMWRTPLEGLQVGGSVQALRLDFDYQLAPEVLAAARMSGAVAMDFVGPVAVKFPVLLWVASAEYIRDELSLASEYSRWSVDLDSSAPGLFPETQVTTEKFYAMASYRLRPWLTPGAYYSVNFPNVERHRDRQNQQHDVALTTRFDVNEHWLWKLEGHFMHGTAGLSSALNDNRPLRELTRNWGVFLVKTTAYF
jgi:hypothetical protein